LSQSTIGATPRDAAVRTKTGGTKPAEPARATKERVTFQLPVSLIEKARDVVFFSPTLRIHDGCAIAPNSPDHGLAFDWKSLDEIKA
jgi:hypothetical protein